MKIVVWLEDNDMRTADRERLVEALDEWKHVADTFILTVRSLYSLSAFGWLMGAKPDNMTLIPGFKTFDLLPHGYDDPAGWEAIAKHVEEVRDCTGSATVLLDSEKALEKFHRGREQIDLATLAHVLSVFADIPPTRTLWYQPQILGDDPRFLDRHAETTRLLQTVADTVPRSAFTCGYAARPGWMFNDGGEVAHLTETVALLSRERMVYNMFVNSSGRLGSGPCYTPGEAAKNTRYLKTDCALIYPGHDEWITAGRAWRAELDWL